MTQDSENLQHMLDKIGQAEAEQDQVSLGAIVHAVGSGSFGPLLLLAGLLTVSPLSGIPGMPTFMGVLTILVSTQLLLGRDSFWLPGWLLKRSFGRSKLEKALKFMRPPARFIDRGIRPRLQVLVGARGSWCIALICTLLGISMPPMEVVPFSVNVVGAILMVFGLALIGRDGLLALGALILTTLLVGFLIRYVLG